MCDIDRRGEGSRKPWPVHLGGKLYYTLELVWNLGHLHYFLWHKANLCKSPLVGIWCSVWLAAGVGLLELLNDWRAGRCNTWPEPPPWANQSTSNTTTVSEWDWNFLYAQKCLPLEFNQVLVEVSRSINMVVHVVFLWFVRWARKRHCILHSASGCCKCYWSSRCSHSHSREYIWIVCSP